MLKNYFTTAINNLLKNKLYSAINIIGLAVGLAACIIITLYVQNELSYDRHWEKADLIYRINNIKTPDNSSKETDPQTSILALSALKKYFSEDIEFGTRIIKSGGRSKIGDTLYSILFARVDKDFINIFNFEEVKGDLKSTLQIPGNIALSEESATKYFGNQDPIGEVITNNEIQYKITAVYRLNSPKTVLNIPGFTLLDDAQIQKGFQNWSWFWPETYVRFSESTDINKFIARLPHFIDKIIAAEVGVDQGKKLSDFKSYFPQKLSDIYFNPFDSTPTWQPRVGNRTVIIVFLSISILVLIIASINFVILTTARATQRAREIAMRKVVGARFKQLVIQIIGESMLVTFIAFLFAIAITELVLPIFEVLMDLKLTVPYTSQESYIFALLLVTLVGISGGFYPALVLSRFSPARTLKTNQTTETNDSFKLRNVLVVFQFTASIVLIIATIVVYFQLLHTNKHDPGFNPDNLLVVEGLHREGISKHRKTLQQELLKLPNVIVAGLSNKQPMELGGGFNLTQHFRPKMINSKPGQKIRFKNNLFVGYNFFKTYEISMLSGRCFTQGRDHEESGLVPPQDENSGKKINCSIIVNLAAARQLGYASADEAIGEILVRGDPDESDYMEFQIIGVAEDSQYRSLRVKPEPEIYHLSPDAASYLAIRYSGDYKTVFKEVKRVWHSVVGNFLFRDSNVKQNLASVFTNEKKENQLLIAFALLTIFIACMGLFGMAAFTVERRVKEIGMRKVMGAKVKDIVNLLGWNFLKPVFISNIIAWPIVIFAMQSWLERFPYRFNSLFMIPICFVSGLIALVIAWFTVAGNTKRVAKSRPIKALRYE